MGAVVAMESLFWRDSSEADKAWLREIVVDELIGVVPFEWRGEGVAPNFGSYLFEK